MFQDNYKKKICRELISNILARKPKMCSFIEWKELKIVYKRYASLYFCAAIDVRCRGVEYEPLNIFALQAGDNELIALEIIHRYVELLDKYFGSVSLPLSKSFLILQNQ